MSLKYNYTTDTFEELYYGLQEIGTQEYRVRADEVLHQFGLTIVPDEREKHRLAMLSILATAEWQHGFTQKGKAEKDAVFARNFGRAA